MFTEKEKLDMETETTIYQPPLDRNEDGTIKNSIPFQSCAEGTHKIDGIIPTLQDIQYDGRTCECGRIKYIAEGCTCNGSKELKSYPNQ